MEDKTLMAMNLTALDTETACITNGGSVFDIIPKLIKKLTPAAFALWVIDNWEDVKSGASDGWNVN